MQEWFKLSSNVVDREDLSIYEKMCCVVLARYSEGENNGEDTTIEHLALKMGVEDIIAKGAFYSLMSKGILELQDQSQIIKPGTIIKANQREMIYENIDEGKATEISEFKLSNLILSSEEKIRKVCEIVDEKISDREAQIVLSFANNDFKKIEAKYKIAKASQYSDKIEVLMHELQKKDERKSNIIKKNVYDGEAEIVGDEKPNEAISSESFGDQDASPQKTQVNTYKLNLMRKYSKK